MSNDPSTTLTETPAARLDFSHELPEELTNGHSPETITRMAMLLTARRVMPMARLGTPMARVKPA